MEMKIPNAGAKILDSLTVNIGILGTFVTILALFMNKNEPQNIIFISISVLFVYILANRYLRQTFITIPELKQLINDLEIERESINQKKGCHIIDEVTKCPFGITKVIEQTEQTIKESLSEANSSYRFLGLCAFNVLNNNENIFYDKRYSVDFEFIVVDPKAKKVLARMDNWRPEESEPLSSQDLSTMGFKKLEKLEKNFQRFHVYKYNHLAKFRIILVDDKRVYLSFYDDEMNVLKTMQLVIDKDPEIKYNLFPWFRCYFNKYKEDITEYDVIKKGKNFPKTADDSQQDFG
jgi:hypothetical protein